MSKAVYVGLAAVALWGAAANAYAASPAVAAEYRLWRPGGNYLTEFMTSPNGLAVFQWHTVENEAFLGDVAVMKDAGDPYVAERVRTAALNGDWSKIAIGRELKVFGPPEDVAANTYAEFVDETEKVAREIGVQPEEVAAATYGDGFIGISRVSRPVIVDLETRAETPLAVAGGDFLYWLNDDELVIGRETSGCACVWQGKMEAIKYDVRNGEREPFASEELAALLNERCTVGVTGVDSIYYPAPYAKPGDLSPPYTSKDWRLLPAACIPKREKPAPPVAVPSRGGQFQNDKRAIYWVPAANGPTVEVASGNALAASDDGVWLFVGSEPEFANGYATFEGFYALRLAWQ
jgi:hypothetical protein